MATRSQAEADEDERELAEWRRANGVPEPKTGRPPLRKTPRGTSYRQGRPHVPQPVQAEPAQATDAPAPSGDSGPEPLRGGSGSPSRGIHVQGGNVGHGIAGAIVGLFAWGFALNFIRGGWSQAAGWFGAKFFNEPYAGASSSTTSASSSTSASSGSSSPISTVQGRPPAGSVASRY